MFSDEESISFAIPMKHLSGLLFDLTEDFSSRIRGLRKKERTNERTNVVEAEAEAE
jgi:hypothetical protein